MHKSYTNEVLFVTFHSHCFYSTPKPKTLFLKYHEAKNKRFIEKRSITEGLRKFVLRASSCCGEKNPAAVLPHGHHCDDNNSRGPGGRSGFPRNIPSSVSYFCCLQAYWKEFHAAGTTKTKAVHRTTRGYFALDVDHAEERIYNNNKNSSICPVPIHSESVWHKQTLYRNNIYDAIGITSHPLSWW